MVVSRFTYDNLLEQKRQLNIAISNQEEKITIFESRIERLQEAVDTLDTNLTPIEQTHKNLDLTIEEDRWQGKEKNNFEKKTQQLRDHVKQYLGKTEDAQEQIKEEITRCETRITGLEEGLSGFNSSLDNVNIQLEERKDEAK